MPYGTLKNWSQEKGYGFIAPDDATRSDGSVFVHVREFRRARIRDVNAGDAFEYQLSTDKSGRPSAVRLAKMKRYDEVR